MRHANEFDPIAYANATGEYKQAGGPRRSDRGYQPSVQALQNLANAPPSALLAIDANVSIYPTPDPGNDEQADASLQAGEWHEARKGEMVNIWSRNSYELVPRSDVLKKGKRVLQDKMAGQPSLRRSACQPEGQRGPIYHQQIQSSMDRLRLQFEERMGLHRIVRSSSQRRRQPHPDRHLRLVWYPPSFQRFFAIILRRSSKPLRRVPTRC